MNESQSFYPCIKFWVLIHIVAVLSISSNNLHAEQRSSDFNFELTPYLWVASIKGTTAVEGEQSPPVDSDYNFFSLDNLDGVASAKFTARKNDWAVLFDFLYVAYEDTFFNSTPLKTNLKLEGTIIELAGSYSPTWSNNIELITGLRQQDISVALTSFNKTPEQSLTWVDPFLGFIYTNKIKDNFHLNLRGDLGGFGIESDRATNAEIYLRYQMNTTFGLSFGYRYLKVKFSDKSFIYDISLDGFLLGLSANF